MTPDTPPIHREVAASGEGAEPDQRTMRCWRFHQFGHIDQLQMEEVPIPVPAGDEVLVKIDFAALNPADKFLVMGKYPGAGVPPFSVGRDGCGQIVRVFPGSRFKPGDRVVFSGPTVGITRDGTLAEYVAITEQELMPLAHWWSAEDGAAGTKVLLTSWQALVDAAGVAAGEVVLVTGASGGVGLAALAVSKALGARTIALSRDANKAQRLLELGADHVFDASDPDVVDKVRNLGGADVVIEVVGGRSLARSLAMANDYGRVCIVGALEGIRSEINPMEIIFKRIQIMGVQVSMYTVAESQEALRRLYRVLEPGRVKLPIDRIFPFEQVQEAFRHMRQGPMGKVVIGPLGKS